MGYWEIITAISKKNSIDLKEAVKKYNSLTGIPEKESYNSIRKMLIFLNFIYFWCNYKIQAVSTDKTSTEYSSKQLAQIFIDEMNVQINLVKLRALV